MAKQLLTKKKQRWVKMFKPTAAVRGEPLRYNVAVERRYVKDMESLVNQVIEETEKEVKRILSTPAAEEYFVSDAMDAANDGVAMDASIASIARIDMNKLTKQVMQKVRAKAKLMSNRMVNASDKASKSSLHHSLKEMSGGLSIKTNISSSEIQNAFKASVNANVDLIETISSNYLQQVKGAVDRSIQGRGGLKELTPIIDKFLDSEARKTRNKAKNVALDQTRKAYNSLNAARMEKIGVKKFEWIHSGGGQTPRPYHIAPYPEGLNGGIFSIDNPPVIDPKTGERGLPGQAIDCKCTMRPIVEFDEGVQVE